MYGFFHLHKIFAKLAMRIKRENGSEVLIYNGINNYILQAILKELLSNAL
ncbi:hypothetical protein EfmAA818_09740 [Enterococcus faecium]|nr:hypothetical protein EfmAA818_09740 [Enterococcus faecium]